MVKIKLLFLLLIICSTKTTCMHQTLIDDLLSDEYHIINQNDETVYDMQYFFKRHFDVITNIHTQTNTTYYLAALIATKPECYMDHHYARSLISSFLKNIKSYDNLHPPFSSFDFPERTLEDRLNTYFFDYNFYGKSTTDSFEELHEQLYHYFAQDTLTDDRKLISPQLTRLLKKIFPQE